MNWNLGREGKKREMNVWCAKLFPSGFFNELEKHSTGVVRSFQSPFNEIVANLFNPPPLYWSVNFSSPRLPRRTQKWNFRQSEQCEKSPWRRNGLRWKSSSSRFHGQSADDKNLSLKCLDGFFSWPVTPSTKREEKKLRRLKAGEYIKGYRELHPKFFLFFSPTRLKKGQESDEEIAWASFFCVSRAMRTKGKYFRRPRIESLRFILLSLSVRHWIVNVPSRWKRRAAEELLQHFPFS